MFGGDKVPIFAHHWDIIGSEENSGNGFPKSPCCLVKFKNIETL
jgi:hypothetical protein